MRKEAVSNKRVSGQISANYNCWNSETPPLQGPLMTHMLSWATISTSYNTTFSYCFPIGLPSLITNYLVFSLLSLSQPLKCYCKGTYLHFPLLSTLSLHVETILLGAGWISGRSKMRRLSFQHWTATPQSEVSCYNTDILLTSTTWDVWSAGAFTSRQGLLSSPFLLLPSIAALFLSLTNCMPWFSYRNLFLWGPWEP